MEKGFKHLVVTGASKGIGYGIIDRILANKNTTYKIILASRKIEEGKSAFEEFKSKYSELSDLVSVLQLDINETSSVDNFLKVIETEFGGRIDCLVNNAGVMWKDTEITPEIFDYTLQTNYFSTVNFTEKILEKGLLNEGGKIVNIASLLGIVFFIENPELANRIKDTELNEEKILELLKECRDSIVDKTYAEKGWPSKGWINCLYKLSKLFLNKYTGILSKRKSIIDKNIQVYSCCPGWVRTNMGGPQATKSLEEGTITPVYVIDLDYNINVEHQGKFFSEGKLVDVDTYVFTI